MTDYPVVLLRSAPCSYSTNVAVGIPMPAAMLTPKDA